jgi:hypothetical protein
MTPNSKKRFFFILNEINFLYFIILMLLKQNVCLYRIRPFNKLFTIPLRFVVNICYKHNLFIYIKEISEIDLIGDRWVFDGYPHFNTKEKYDAINCLLKINRKYNYWQDPFNDYSYSYKAINKEYIDTVVKDVLWIEWLNSKLNGTSYTIIGKYEDINLYLTKKKMSIFSSGWNILCNTLTFIFGSMYFIYWLLIRTRPYKISKVYYDIIADNDLGMRAFYNKIVEKNDSMVFYSWRENNKKHDNVTININNALVDFSKFILLVVSFLRDVLFLITQSRSWDSILFFMQFRQVIARYRYEAFFFKFHAKVFFINDDYSNEHIVRTMVLRKLGIKSVSTNHGLPFRINQAGIWKYIDYDVYYVYGLFIYQKYYQQTWSNYMNVKAIGSLRIPTKYYPKMSLTSRSKDILFLWGRTEDIRYDNMLIDAIYSMADAFKDRKIYVRPKPTRISDHSTDNLLKSLSSNPKENIILKDKDLLGQYLTYDLMTNCMYSIGVGSTTVAESVQCGCISFFLDYDKRTKDVYYQNFQQLCVDNVDEAIKRIKDVEIGKYSYNFEKLNGLIDLSRVDPIDAIRKDLNLV